jgi:transcriptional regulator with XRE-family HTH domain
MTAHDGPGPTRAQRAASFGRWSTDAARAAGFDVDSQRGGGRAEIAKLTGMSPTTVGRMLAGRSLPSPKFYGAIAKAFHRPLREVLIEVSAATDDMLEETAVAAAEARRISPQEAAERIGIRKPANVRLFVATAELMLQQEADENGAA